MDKICDAAQTFYFVALDQIQIIPQRELLDDPGAPDDPLRFDRSSHIIDYVRLAGAQVLTFELDDIEMRGLELEDQWRKSSEEAIGRGRQAPPLETLALPWAVISPWLKSARHITQLALDDTPGLVHVSCQPAPEFKGRIADWVDEIGTSRPRLKAYRARLLAHPAVSKSIEGARPYRAYFPLGAPDRDVALSKGWR